MGISTELGRLENLLTLLAEHWTLFTEDELLNRAGPGRWSRKEVLGHLVDSAANNHSRFVLAQLAGPLQMRAYDQDAWVRLSAYQHLSSAELLALWTTYNRFFLHLLVQIPEETLAVECFTPNANPVTLCWLINDYVLHLEHHVQQIIYEHE